MIYEILETRNYTQFKRVPGNRPVQSYHIKELIKYMSDNGNLTQDFPIVVNEKMQIIDGQHRLQALKILKWPVFYRVKENLNISTVSNINIAQRNWTWRDYASMYGENGNEEYQWLLKLDKIHGSKYPVSIYGQLFNLESSRAIKRGAFAAPIAKRELAGRILDQIDDIYDLIGVKPRAYTKALVVVMKSPNYNHKQMMSKMELRQDSITVYNKPLDNQRAIEEIYNYKQGEANRRRLY